MKELSWQLYILQWRPILLDEILGIHASQHTL